MVNPKVIELDYMHKLEINLIKMFYFIKNFK